MTAAPSKKVKLSLRKRVCFSLAILVAFIGLLECVVRVVNYARARAVGRVLDDELGWKTLPDVSWTHSRSGYGSVTFSTQRYGFRRFGDPKTEKKKLLVMGDSFTHGTTVNDGNTYYDYLEKHADNVEVFAYGCGGYGTLQEFMIVDEYFDEIQPDLIIWQFCGNDIMNNVYELERVADENNMMVRPYLRDGKVVRLYPSDKKGVYAWLSQHSHLFRFFESRLTIGNGDFTKLLNTSEILARQDRSRLARSVTSEILQRLRARVGNTPIIGFTIGDDVSSKFLVDLRVNMELACLQKWKRPSCERRKRAKR